MVTEQIIIIFVSCEIEEGIMGNIYIDSLDIESLKKSINEIREILDELCITTEEINNSEERLAVSQYLDDLIVAYMKQFAK